MSKFSQLPGFESELDSSSNSLHSGRRVLITVLLAAKRLYDYAERRDMAGKSYEYFWRQRRNILTTALASESECLTPTNPCDVTSRASTLMLFAFARTAFGGHPPDIVIANAGVSEVGHLEDDIVLRNEYGVYPKKPLQVTLDVNLAGAILTAETAENVWEKDTLEPGHQMARQRKLVLISSMGGWEGIPMGTEYSMAKHGLLGYWVALSAKQESRKDTTFSCHAICPFFAATPILDTAILLALAGIPKTTPEDVAHAIEAVGRDAPVGTQRQPGDAEYKSTTVVDIKQALAHNKQAKPLLGAAIAAFAVNILAKQLSAFHNVAFGFLAAAVISYVTPKAKAKGKNV
ncbi:hypothetical protein QFC19_001939 [Naganishia cerealis]|uniref:Uncharacterized protein n=1 Tax=Naganishia cerealis TaxID=610337 RepID=A0ACC2WEU5_9TREE|nr:hypothetical protein QFC19_001939 [Naganishia cerealis]